MKRAHVMRCIRVIVNASKESRCRIAANVLSQKMTTSRMLIHERRNVVNEASDSNQRTLFRLLQVWIIARELRAVLVQQK